MSPHRTNTRVPSERKLRAVSPRGSGRHIDSRQPYAMNLISPLLPEANVLLDVDVSSKKRVFEQAGLLFENNHQIARSLVFDSLFAREKLGSTGLG